MSIKPLAMVLGLVNVVQAQSYARDAMKYLGAVMLAKGIGDAALWEAAVGFGVAAVGTLWSQLMARQKKIVETAATVVPIEPHLQRAAGVDTPKTPT